MDTFFLAFVGFFAGFLVCARIGTFVGIVVKERRAAHASGHARFPAYLALVHSGPWLLLGTVIFLLLFVRATNPPAWSYVFLLGFCIAPIAYAVLLSFTILHLKAKRARNSQA